MFAKIRKAGCSLFVQYIFAKRKKRRNNRNRCNYVCYQGIFVFEIKNYSGWIFGNEKYKTWTQTLPQGKGKKAKKEKFLNPIMQNKLHIECLQEVLGEDLENVPIFSVVVFSNRCELKKLELSSNEAVVIKREKLPLLVKKYCKVKPFLTYEMIEELYKTLYPLTQFSDDVKKKHIEDIQKHF
ncbi:MAG: nuclease-related domain-containing protein [Eubacterium sp.]